ncbi:SusD/RagB family nutrient-binding outer membrane lipoprotein [Aureispira anguillae]|uniref:SusD/RagB family nutrient-binding outer membranelipoprotein n=1 Tax=Aureispira anguillae TaxID=2864201 RepID=A0A915YBY1_9BACT|nr:SusD/RagB family nutrient-binding outer membrane lipoprotein [Aureispira anguillae]BDS10198.1 SusD/RagB family nutrient-binding outer membranelipoprotein [Aureispira anguillae]
MKIQFNKYIKYGLFSVCMAASLSACKKHYEQLNTDPNEPSSTSTSFLLSNAQKYMMDFTWDEWFNSRRGNQLAQYWASNQYSNESRYAFRVGVTNNYWSYFYSRPLQDLQEIIRLNETAPNDYIGFGKTENQIAVAKVLQAWLYQNMTDCWGPIPFSQALQGAEYPFPKYDSQKEVYTGLLAKLDEAINAFDVSDNSLKGDVIYDGDVVKWKKLANSLKMRVALRMADVEPTTAATAVSEAIASGVFESNADNALFSYVAGAPNNNPQSEDYKTRNDFAASSTMVDELQRLNDPRVGFYYAPAVNSGNYVGEVYGLSEANAALTANDDISQRNAQVLAESAPGIYLDYAQVEFMLAEAAERGISGAGDAATHYNNGITASMQFWDAQATLSLTDINNYIAQATVDYNTLRGSESWKKIIGRQKWIALYMQGIQGWAEYRRLDFGILQAPADGTLEGTSIPHRMIYPNDEQTLNGDKYAEGVSLLGGTDNLDTKLWWDVN